jgi:hypothetical protein
LSFNAAIEIHLVMVPDDLAKAAPAKKSRERIRLAAFRRSDATLSVSAARILRFSPAAAILRASRRASGLCRFVRLLHLFVKDSHGRAD